MSGLRFVRNRLYKSFIATIARAPAGRPFRILTNHYVQSEFASNIDGIRNRYVTSLKSALDNFSVLETFLSEVEWKVVKQKLGVAKANEQALVADFDRVAGIVRTYINSPHVTNVPVSDAVKLQTVERAIAKTPPMHRNKNAIVDTLHLLSLVAYCDANPNDQDQYYFITENTDDFSSDTDRRHHNEGLEPIFTGRHMSYSINVAETLNAIVPGATSQTVIESINLERYYCKDGLGHDYDDERGAFLRSQYGGLTWQIRCSKCGMVFDTGDSLD